MTKSAVKERIVLLLLLSSVLFSLLTPIEDPDFFWHLATGRWIYEHKELPKEDPFSYTTSLQTQEEISTAKTMLTQYWLANLIQYGVYKAGNYSGIIALRLVVALCVLLITFLRLRKAGLSIAASVIVLLPLAYLLTVFKGDRPNQMTFLFLAIFLFLIDALREGRKIGYLLPVVFVVWANIHGGFILGALIALVYIFAESIRWLLMKRGSVVKRRIGKEFLLLTALTLLAGFVNPNGYMAIFRLSGRQALFEYKTTENFSPFAYMQQGNYILFFVTLTLFLAALFSILRRVLGSAESMSGIGGKGGSVSVQPVNEKKGASGSYVAAATNLLEEILLVLFLGILSFTAVRYIPLFTIAATPVIGRLLREKTDLQIKRFAESLLGITFVLALFFWVAFKSYPATIIKNDLIGSDYPAGAATFIQEERIAGRVFNYVDWGGYLIWRFYPEKVVFTDGRILNEHIKKLYLSVSNGNVEPVMGIPAYQAVFDTYAVKHILIPPVDLRGYFLPLIPLLVNDPQWKLIFTSENSLLFSRDYGGSDYPKSIAYEVAMRKSLSNIRSDPDNAAPYIAVAKSLIGLGKRDEAVLFLKGAIQKRSSLQGGPVEKTLILIEQS